ncbi:MAG TPA: RhuM family protein [Puia sp.]|nr:RhuM family protein [Puia sp.]
MSSGKGEVVIYEIDGKPHLEIKLSENTLWLSQRLMADLFEKDADTIGLHIKNIYVEEELDEKSTSSLFSVAQQEGRRTVNRSLTFYNLDVILSVGYRVSSKRGTAFRKWANTVLNDYLVKGYAHNEKLLHEKQAQLDSLKQAVALITNVTGSQALSSDEALTCEANYFG